MSADQKLASKDPLFEVPIEIVPLPSGGKVYPVGSPLHGRTELEILSMTAKHENILTSPALAKKGTMLTELMRACLVDRSIDPDSMIVGDRYALLAAIRVTGYGPHLQAQDVECSECGARTDRTFDIREFELKRLEIDPIVPGQNLFAFVLPRSKRKVEFRFMTGADEQDMHVADQRMKKLGAAAASDNVTGMLVRTLVSVDGIADPARVAGFVMNMSAFDSLALRSYMGDVQPGLEFKQKLACTACGHVEEVACPLDAGFLWPKLKRSA